MLCFMCNFFGCSVSCTILGPFNDFFNVKVRGLIWRHCENDGYSSMVRHIMDTHLLVCAHVTFNASICFPPYMLNVYLMISTGALSGFRMNVRAVGEYSEVGIVPVDNTKTNFRAMLNALQLVMYLYCVLVSVEYQRAYTITVWLQSWSDYCKISSFCQLFHQGC